MWGCSGSSATARSSDEATTLYSSFCLVCLVCVCVCLCVYMVVRSWCFFLGGHVYDLLLAGATHDVFLFTQVCSAMMPSSCVEV